MADTSREDEDAAGAYGSAVAAGHCCAGGDAARQWDAALHLYGAGEAATPISENTVRCALQSMGFAGEMTAHGFRSMASTLLNEMGWRSDVIERQLAHVDKNKVRSAYNRAEYITERRR